MKLTVFLIVLLSIFVITGCQTAGDLTEVSSAEPAPVPAREEEKAEPVEIVTTVFYRVMEEYYFGDGVKDEYRVFVYNNDGSVLLGEQAYSADDVMYEKVEYEYPSSDSSVRKTYDGAGSLLNYSRSLMDSDGNLIVRETYDSKDTLQSRSEYEYLDGNKMTWRVLSGSGSLLSSSDYIYESGSLVRIESFTPGGVLSEYFELSYDNDGRLTETHHYNSEAVSEGSRTVEYENEFPVMEIVHRANGSVQRKILYVNDQFGNPVEIVQLDAGDNVQERLAVEYGSREEIYYEK